MSINSIKTFAALVQSRRCVSPSALSSGSPVHGYYLLFEDNKLFPVSDLIRCRRGRVFVVRARSLRREARIVGVPRRQCRVGDLAGKRAINPLMSVVRAGANLCNRNGAPPIPRSPSEGGLGALHRLAFPLVFSTFGYFFPRFHFSSTRPTALEPSP